MAKATPLINNFNAGELDPKIDARSDQQKYYSGCRTLENAIPLVLGGARSAPGTYYVCGSGDDAHYSVMVPFTYSTVQAYMLEFGHNYIRFYKDNGVIVDGGGSPISVVTTYTESELRQIKFRQTANTLYIFHPSHNPATLTRSSHTSWTLADMVFYPPPSREVGYDCVATLTPAAVSGANVQFDAGSSIFLAADVGRTIEYGTALAKIVTVDSATRVHADILSNFPNTSPIPSGDWLLGGSPGCGAQPHAVAEGALTYVGTDAAAFRSNQAGMYIKVNGGVCKITAYTNTQRVEVVNMTTLSSTDLTTDWSLEDAAWSATLGYPGCCHFFDGCLWAAGTATDPTTAWKSRAGDFTNFGLGTEDDDATQFRIESGSMDRILWIAGDDSLVIGSSGGVWKPEESSTGEPISAAKPPSFRKYIRVGVKDIDPVATVDSLLWVSKTGRTVRRLVYSLEQDRTIGRDMMRLASHITIGSNAAGSGIVAMAFQQDPIPIHWCVRADGVLLGQVFNTEEDVYAWFRIVTDGSFEAVGVLTQDDKEDQVWVQTSRTISSATSRMIEYFMPHEFFGQINDAFFLHSGLTYSGASTPTITGLDHLDGRVSNGPG